MQSKKINRRACLLWLLTLLWTALLFVFSGQSAQDSARLSGGLTQWLLDWLSFPGLPADQLEHILRKLAHFCMFGVEGLLVQLSLRSVLRGRGGIAPAAAICLIVAGLNEFHQTFFAGRSAQLSDVALDFVGALLGMLLALLLHRLRGRRPDRT